MSSLYGIDASEIPAIWPAIVGLVAAGCEDGNSTPDDVLEALCAKCAQLVVSVSDDGIEGVLVTELVTQKSGRLICNIWVVAGKNMDGWFHYLPELEGWARSKGCGAIGISSGRPGWARVLKPHGYGVTKVVLEKEL